MYTCIGSRVVHFRARARKKIQRYPNKNTVGRASYIHTRVVLVSDESRRDAAVSRGDRFARAPHQSVSVHIYLLFPSVSLYNNILNVYIKLGRVRRTHIYIMGMWSYEKTIFRVQVLQVHLELRAAPFRGSIEIPSHPTLPIVKLDKLRLLRTKYPIIVQLLGL